MTTTNPLQTDGFEFVEFTAPTPAGVAQLHTLFELLGFTAVARHRSKDVTLFKQGDIHFLVNGTPYTHFAQFAIAHGPSACAMGWRVKDAPAAFRHAVGQGCGAVRYQAGLHGVEPAGRLRHRQQRSLLYRSLWRPLDLRR